LSEDALDYRDRLREAAGRKAPTGGADAKRWGRYVAKNRRRWRGRLPEDRGAPILEIGCGDGQFVRFLRQMGYRNAEGFDVDATRIEEARRRAVEGVFRADLRTFFDGERECTYERVFALNVVEHLRKDEALRLMEDVFRVLRPGGEFWLRVPNGAGIFGGYTRYIEFTHEAAYTTNSLTEVLRFAGFRDLRFYPWGPIPHGVRSALRFLGWQAVTLLLRFVSLLETASTKGGIYTADLLACARRPKEDD
jgi:SAM-dependent methyltransferase